MNRNEYCPSSGKDGQSVCENVRAERGILFDIQHGSFVDGPGIRTTVFFKGCNLHCAWCHNPESQRRTREKLIFTDKCIRCGKCKAVCPSPGKCTLCGRCAEVCPRSAIQLYGEERSVDDVLSEIRMDRIFYGDETDTEGKPDPMKNGGVTFSGGECMLQPEFLTALLKACKNEGISTAVDTAGNVPRSSFEQVLPYTDLFLYDLKAMDPGIHEKYIGVGNARILDNYRFLKSAGAKIIVRVPVIPDVNDTEENFSALRSFFDDAGWPEKTELLPYHKLGENKYPAMRLECQNFRVPEKEEVDALYRMLKKSDLNADPV